VAAVVAVAVGLLAAAGCTTTVEGSGAAAPSPTPAATSTPPTGPRPTTSGPTTSGPTTSGPPLPRSALRSAGLPDECLLNAAEFGALVGRPVRPPEQSSVGWANGSVSSGCVATAAGEPVAMTNVYGVRTGAPADYVRAAPTGGHRELPGVGEAAIVLDTATGPTLQLAGEKYLVTILVSAATPSDDAWRAAGAAALSRLPG
jgi:hypothetical protein